MNRLEPLIFELSAPGRTAYSLPELDVPSKDLSALLPPGAVREAPPELPEVSEVDVVRHFVRLSHLNHGVDVDFYPLGSCTMKYNPKINEDMANLPGFAHVHPYTPQEAVQGLLKLMYDLQRDLCEIGGMDRFTLQPAAGAHGEFAGLSIIRAYLVSMGQGHRNKVIIPDSGHGTNPATAVMNGCVMVEVKSDARGGVDLDALRAELDHNVAALMLTNPNTLGLADENIHIIARMVHQAGGLLYYDGANANGTLGWTRPGDMGFDVMHFNLHKTFATPHGGGGPGSGPVGVKERLAAFLPVPTVEFDGQRYFLDYNRPQSIGKVRSLYGNVGVAIKAYTYIREMGAAGLKRVTEDAVLNANYLMAELKKHYLLPYDRYCKHEFVLSGNWQKNRSGVRTLDISKRTLDFGMHPPTNYFPLIVDEAMMIEPTETESKETLDRYIRVLKEIDRETAEEPDKVKDSPHTTPVGRLDEITANRKPNLRWRKDG
ncbi:MAG: aminomethyl-transferring glycine dehydrogenase subunit GcvPB [Bacillota bacterium]|nr:aminomethyl-transferring glycine dehydrogenase subunit GcvPB [Bacillota bacterium]